jgi:asparagine N-glycosylation enzyme membrane subunit Stt3
MDCAFYSSQLDGSNLKKSQRSLMNVAKILPVAGGAVCGIYDFFTTKAIGNAAKGFYG